MVVSSFCCCFRRSHSTAIITSHPTQQLHAINVAAPPHHSPRLRTSSTSYGSLHVFSLNDLRVATRDFHHDNKLGQGGFGVVYKGTLTDGREVAVKKLSLGSGQGDHEFMNEVSLLTTVQHRNLIQLLGCCVEDSERLLVYEYLPNRSLDKHLFDVEAGSKLDWRTRRDIILGMAKGLMYLHEDSRVRMVHRDIKPSNILLDDRFVPKIADFGMARFFSAEKTHVSTRMAGTLGYLAPEYAFQGKLTEKADIFSFGVVVLEIISGRKNNDRRLPQEKQRLLDLAWRLYEEHRLMELLDQRLLRQASSSTSGVRGLAEQVQRVVHVALLCTQANAVLRPAMSKVVLMLSGKSSIRQDPARPAYVEHFSSSEVGESSAGTGATKLTSSNSSHQHHNEILSDSSSTFPQESFATNDETQIEPR